MIATPTQESLPIRKRERKIIARRNYFLKTRGTTQYINVKLRIIMDKMCRYVPSIAPWWLRTPILPGLLHLRPGK